MPLYRLLLCGLLCMASCRETPPAIRTPLLQRAYVWQRGWTPAVSAAVRQSTGGLHGHVLLGSEVVWRSGQPRAVRASIDWSSVATCALALRVAPRAVPLERAAQDFILQESLHLLATAKAQKVTCTELQLDFDCAQKKLASYRPLVQALRTAIQPTPLVITTLPVWLDEPEFPALIAAADRYVLQVHSVQPIKPGAKVAICDPDRARKAVTQANKLGREFEVALPTYSALVGIGPDERVIGYAFEGGMPSWPEGTRLVPYRVEPDDMADLIREWLTHRPMHLRGVMWFRLPVPTDTRNWTWPQLAIAMTGQNLQHLLTARTEGSNPVDVILVNAGQATDPVQPVIASWPPDRKLIAAEALPGWTVTTQPQSARFAPAGYIHPAQPADEPSKIAIPSLPPGARRSIGWLRFDQPAAVHVKTER